MDAKAASARQRGFQCGQNFGKGQIVLETLAEEILRQRSKLRELASELILAEQRERCRLAEVLHDNLQQLLVAARFRLISLERSADPAVKEIAIQVQDLLDQSIRCSRSLTDELSPQILYQGGLVLALEWLAGWMKQKHDLDVEIKADEDVRLESADVRILLFQSVRELLFNAVKHAKVKTAQVQLCRLADHVEVTVSDNGSGFDPEAAMPQAGQTKGLGLFSIRERLVLLGGKMEIDSALGRGSRFRLLAPRKSAAAVADEGPVTPAYIQVSKAAAASDVFDLVRTDDLKQRP